MSESDDLKREGRLLVEPTPTADIDDYSCIFCYTGLESEEVFGSVYTFDELKVHYNCLLLTTNCAQNGGYQEGVLGFMPDDIRRAHKKSQKKVCSREKCGQIGASIVCARPTCKRRYHLPCAIAEGCLSQFTGAFATFCRDHLPAKIAKEEHVVRGCHFCGMRIKDLDPVLRVPSCCDKAWYHRDCMQKYAYEVGFHVRCPYCQESTENYREMLRQRGIHVSANVESLRCLALVCRCPHAAGAYHISSGACSLKQNLCCGSYSHIGCMIENIPICRACPE